MLEEIHKLKSEKNGPLYFYYIRNVDNKKQTYPE